MIEPNQAQTEKPESEKPLDLDMFNMFDKKPESNPPGDDLFNFLLQPKSNENSGLQLKPESDNLRQSATSDGYNTTFERLLNREDYESPDKALIQKQTTNKPQSANDPPNSEFQQNQAETPV